ncbi:aminotransferase class I/II-fold pyridoxal phosphate-dependent enzyme [Candidatus Margulisiibacteriota bacterium]
MSKKNQVQNKAKILNQKKIIKNNEIIHKAEEVSFSISKTQSPKNTGYLNTIKTIWKEAKFENVSHLYSENQEYSGRILYINQKPLLNFGSCGYFGLEFDPRLRKAAKQAIDNFGTQFAFPPVYMALNLYEELKDKYKKIFGANLAIGSTTTLAHLSCIPVMVRDNDAILIDQHVHHSVQMATKLISAKDIKMKFIPHNNLNYLESKIQQLRNNHRRIWYFADGVYSMKGDCAPVKELQDLQLKYPELYLYIDDAHGMSWKGEHGRGFVLDQTRFLDRTIIAISHAKCFGSAGGTLIIDDPELEYQVRNFGSTMIFSGPMQPALLGAALASADIHLSEEIYYFQEILAEKIALRNKLIKERQLPIAGPFETPISFIGIGDAKTTGEVVQELFNEGYYVNISLYPAVPKNRNGIRFTTTCLQKDQDIINFIDTLEQILRRVFSKNNSSIEEICQKFNPK